ncbi:MAG: PilZ domain-containing protein [Candidatus Binatia bacterium]
MKPETTPPAEKRQLPRRHPRVRLVTQVQAATSIGRTENISVGGMLLFTRDTFEQQTEVTVRFNLPSGRSIEAQGVVTHAQAKVKMGIQFLQMKDKDAKAIEEFVKQACEESDSGAS